MVQGPGNGDGPDGPTGIVIELTVFINARPVLWDKPTISFAQVVEEWNKLDPERYVKDDLPGIDWTAEDGKKGFSIRQINQWTWLMNCRSQLMTHISLREFCVST